MVVTAVAGPVSDIMVTDANDTEYLRAQLNISRAANDPSVFTITKKASARAFSWLALALSHLRHY